MICDKDYILSTETLLKDCCLLSSWRLCNFRFLLWTTNSLFIPNRLVSRYFHSSLIDLLKFSYDTYIYTEYIFIWIWGLLSMLVAGPRGRSSIRITTDFPKGISISLCFYVFWKGAETQISTVPTDDQQKFFVDSYRYNQKSQRLVFIACIWHSCIYIFVSVYISPRWILWYCECWSETSNSGSQLPFASWYLIQNYAWYWLRTYI